MKISLALFRFIAAFSAIATLLIGLPRHVEAEPRRNPGRTIHRQLHGPQGLLTRSRYRPKVKIRSFARDGKVAELTAEFSTRRGFTDRIEVRIDGKIHAAVKMSKPVSKGAVKFRVDLSKAGPGEHSLRLWAWQGRQGYQSVHGESAKTKFTN